MSAQRPAATEILVPLRGGRQDGGATPRSAAGPAGVALASSQPSANSGPARERMARSFASWFTQNKRAPFLAAGSPRRRNPDLNHACITAVLVPAFLVSVFVLIPSSPTARAEEAARTSHQTSGVNALMPVFRDRAASRLTFPLAWQAGRYTSPDAWRAAGRAKVMECLLKPPPSAAFDPAIVAEEDRGTYTARKIAFNVTADSRVLAYLLVPKGKGPFPAVLLFHDHGARFDIGKEKMIRPWEERAEKMRSAQEWVERSYGGRFVGDALAARGYVCFATDALNWSDRGGAGYEGQQALASNLLHLGMSWAGLIAHEDLRAAEFLSAQPEVDSRRVAALGLSMGAYRTWQAAALSDRIAAGVAVCWMARGADLMTAGNNQTSGQSAFSMTHPGLPAYLDYPDVASLAAPKPLLFYNGLKDGLFPVESVRAAYARMREVWESRAAGSKLETRLWDVPHVFDQAMQDEAFRWLDQQLKPQHPD